MEAKGLPGLALQVFKNDQPPTLEQKHFVMATLIRGGVFGDAGKE